MSGVPYTACIFFVIEFLSQSKANPPAHLVVMTLALHISTGAPVVVITTSCGYKLVAKALIH